MDNKVRVTIRVKDDGTYDIINKKASKYREEVDKTSNSVEKGTRKRNAYNRQEKGVANNTSNSTKAFAKQAQTIGGTLVPAYATLAANVFAATAVFSALRNAAALEQLEAGLIAVGSAAGQNLPYVASQLREITGAAISSQSAMQAVALGTSAGFDVGQLEGLTKVAKGASLALGRDMEDAMNRLIRGAAKLEPEILDELGIMVRLDDAATAYAASLNRTANELTVFERRQAFANAIIEQGTDKFGEIADKIDPNPYDQLAATFNDLVRTIFDGINIIAKPIAEIFSGAPTALLGGMVLFGSTIASQMLPALSNMAEKSYETAEALSKQAAATKNVTVARNLNTAATIKGVQAEAIAAASSGNLKDAIKLLRVAYIETAAAAVSNAVVSGPLATAWGVLVGAGKALITTLSAITAAFLRFLPWIGLITLGVGLLAPKLKNLFGGGNLILEEQANKATESFISFKDINDSLAISLESTNDEVERYVKISRAVAGTTSQIQASYKTLVSAMDEIEQAKIKEIFLELQEAQQALDKARSSTSPSQFGSVSLTAAEARVNALTRAFDEASEAAQKPNIEEGIAVISRSIRSLEGEEALGDAMKQRLVSLQDALDNIKNAKTNQEIDKIFEALDKGTREYITNLDSMADAFGRFSEVVAKRKRGTGPFAGEVEAGAIIVANLKKAANETERAALAEEAKGIFTGKSADEIQNMYSVLVESNNQIAESVSRQKELTQQAKELTELSRINAAALSQKIELENKALQVELAALDLQKEQEEVLRGTALTGAELLEYENKRNTILTKIVTSEEKIATVRQAQLRDTARQAGIARDREIAQRGIVNSLLEQQRLEAQLRAASGPRPRSTLNPMEELKLFQTAAKARRAEIEENAKNQMRLNNEAAQREIQSLQLRKTETKNISQEQLNAIDKEIQLRQAALEVQQYAALDEAEVAKTRIAVEERILELRAAQNALSASATGNTVAERALSFSDAGGEAALQTSAEKVQAIRNIVTPLIDDLKSLGPEGEVAAAVGQGALNISEGWANVGDVFENSSSKMERATAIAGAMAQTISSIASISKAASDARIAGIDAEIEAEKRRDGKSAESLAKIQQLEAKKEKAARKAFEMNKKMQIAQAIASTAAGVAGALGSKPWTPFNFAMAALVGAMGAAQIAIISGTSFQGSGSSASASSVPSQISLGQRQSSVDLARSSSAAGEIAYMRGEQGVGSSASNFRPAFTGMKYRASGGAVAGYMVGEQGPEMFVPDVPGRIVPADETGASSGVSNVNFTINAVDAAGIEDVLVSQRGNIIGMLREAANAHGQEFLEAVDVSVYAAPNRRTV